MARFAYTDRHGADIPREAWNSHHVFFQRNRYKSALDKQFRSLGGLVLPLLIPVHRELHAHVSAPPKPDPELMRETIQFAKGIEGDYYDRFLQLAEFLGANASCTVTRNLDKQAPFILDGQVRTIHE